MSLIMEAMGGGGHNTMASVELRDATPESVKKALIRAINVSYYGEKSASALDSAEG